MRGLCSVVGVLGLVALAGCGGGDGFDRQAVSGTVTYKGKPIVFGSIDFSPQSGQNTPLNLEIKDGKFAAEKSRGLSAGKYLVRIIGYDGPPPPPTDIPGQTSGPLQKVITPEKYGAKSDRTVDIQGGKNELKFDLD